MLMSFPFLVLWRLIAITERDDERIVETFQNPDFPWHQRNLGHSHECIEIGPFERRDAEAAARFPPPEPMIGVPEIRQRCGK